MDRETRLTNMRHISGGGDPPGMCSAEELEVKEGMRNSTRSRFLIPVLLAVFLLVGTGIARELHELPMPEGNTDARPPLVWVLHNLSNVWCAFLNIGIYGDPWENYPRMEWPGGEGSNYLWIGNIWSCVYGPVTPTGTVAKYASTPDYSAGWELWPSEGYPVVKLSPGSIALEQSEYGYDDWEPTQNDDPYGMRIYEYNLGWGTPGFNDFIATDHIITHHSEFGNPGIPLDAFSVSIMGDCDVATVDATECHLDDMVYYDGHAIWCNDPDATFEYEFDGGVKASEQDIYTYQQNPDNPLPPEDPQNIFYYYNYMGGDDILDNDVDGNGVSDHFTVIFKIVDDDTIYTVEPNTGLELFADGAPPDWYEHTVGDTIYCVIPRNMSNIWDTDNPGTGVDDSGEPELDPPANGFIAWRLLDFWIKKVDGTIERPADVYGVPIVMSHSWWNWESDPGNDIEKYNYMWGENPDQSGRHSGPAYYSDWIGNPNAPSAFEPANPGPFPVVHDNPIALGYPQFDYRFLICAGPVELADGDSLHFVGGWLVGLGLAGAREVADNMLDAYYRDGGWGVPKLPPAPILFYQAGDGFVQLEWGANAETYTPFGGYNIYRATFEPSGWTLMRTENAGTHSWTDTSVQNGFPYYYVVTAYDEVTTVESTKSNYRQTLEGTPVPVVPSWTIDAGWMDNVSVVPNPYRGSAEWEQTYFDKIAFINLPAMCDIDIYTLAGDLVVTLEHRSESGAVGTEYWDLLSRNEQEITSGLYVYRVATADDFVIGKFAIIR